MADTTGIEWADSTWNPLVGCTKVSPGCDNCYAETLVNRFAPKPGEPPTNSAFPARFDVVTIRSEKFLTQPLRWRKPRPGEPGRKVFVNSLSDLFHADVPDDFIASVFGVMAATPWHTYQLLTKRHGRMRSLLSSPVFRALVDVHAGERGADPEAVGWPLPNVWLGVSVEDQQRADLRVWHLLDTPAAVRWVSAEPLLGPVDLRQTRPTRIGGELYRDALRPIRDAETDAVLAPRLDWVVVGGESGPGSRPMHPDWVRSLRDQCAAAAVPFLFKQWGSWSPAVEHADGTHLLHVDGRLVPRADATSETTPGVRHDLVDRGHLGWARVRPISKHAAGRHLDRRLHDGYPAA